MAICLPGQCMQLQAQLGIAAACISEPCGTALQRGCQRPATAEPISAGLAYPAPG